MNGIWLTSYLVLWVFVAVLFLAILTMARQIGLLHRRLTPARARMTNSGPPVGHKPPALRVLDLYGQEIQLGGERDKDSLLVFISAACSVCNELAPALRSVWKGKGKTLDLIIISIGTDEEANRTFISRNRLYPVPYIVSSDLSFLYDVHMPPYGLLIDKQGIVRTKGMVNHLDHLESLINVLEVGHPTMEAWSQARGSKQIAPTGSVIPQ